ncbi:hypothetical protein BDA99DRAFT_581143 [Phascolomyces articulosus]|uniref:Uncharacterized protein n=1 Tax=Phascolomyces articulosus TaxID=60185 RepID=A0AAD5PDV7_9FUNG|nr:hypothetical protein BDA99DRAFT_581143 [Phascolomyces articulosus]
MQKDGFRIIDKIYEEQEQYSNYYTDDDEEGSGSNLSAEHHEKRYDDYNVFNEKDAEDLETLFVDSYLDVKSFTDIKVLEVIVERGRDLKKIHEFDPPQLKYSDFEWAEKYIKDRNSSKKRMIWKECYNEGRAAAGYSNTYGAIIIHYFIPKCHRIHANPEYYILLSPIQRGMVNKVINDEITKSSIPRSLMEDGETYLQRTNNPKVAE